MRKTVTQEAHGKRVDVFVVETMPRLSRAFAQKLCDQDKITVNGQPVRAGYKLRLGEVVDIAYDPSELDSVPAIALPVIYEDDDCIVIDKPAGVLTHSQGSLHPEPTVATFLRSRMQTDTTWPDSGRAGVVHRLDRATSGVIIGAKHQAALSFLQRQFAQRKTKKTYLAIVEGAPKEPEAVIDIPIERNPKAPATFRVSPNGKPAITRYRVIESHPSGSLISLAPETGRTHQLRTHMSYIGNPIVGDPLYGKGAFGDRLYLHAASLEITLPNREPRTFTSPMPEEFTEYLHRS